jgi:hypothetical protein
LYSRGYQLEPIKKQIQECIVIAGKKYITCIYTVVLYDRVFHISAIQIQLCSITVMVNTGIIFHWNEMTNLLDHLARIYIDISIMIKDNQKQLFSSFTIIIYHIFCCNMFVFACPIIGRSQCWLYSGQVRGKYPYSPSNSTSLYRSALFGIFLKPDSKQKYLQVEQRQLS